LRVIKFKLPEIIKYISIGNKDYYALLIRIVMHTRIKDYLKIQYFINTRRIIESII